jgi:A/G-specific adenine glycosylase
MSRCYLPKMGEKRTGRGVGTPPGDESHASTAQGLASEIRKRLLEAYDDGKRDLPWRGDSDPYRVWVSEIMLQQTRVETVIPYYKAWMERFPDVGALAAAEEHEVLRSWQGLGYYSRARNLHTAARVVRERLGGEVPGTAYELRSLPGVGEYTAGAVASIAFGEVVPAVDGNVRRVLSRLFDLPAPSSRDLKVLAGGLVDPRRPGDFNQALMELGALICTPRSPACTSCPLSGTCLARARGTVALRPPRKVRSPVPEREEVVVVAVSGDGEDARFLLRRRPDSGLLAGLWEFPGRALTTGSDPDAMAREMLRRMGAGMRPRQGNASDLIPLPAVDHTFTHLKLRYRPFLARGASGGTGHGLPERHGWVSLETIRTDLPLSVAQIRILELALSVLDGGSP